MRLTVAILSDVHLGPAARFDGKLRKLSHRSAELTRAFVRRMNDEVRPDLVVNLGDVVEDEARDVDRARYAEFLELLAPLDAPCLHVAGNHDLAHMTEDDLRALWGARGPLHRSLDHGGVHLVILHTRETKDVDVRIDVEQLDWLRRDLAATRLPVVVFMHHSAADQDLRGNRWFERAPHLCLLRERRALRAVLEESGKVLAVVNGHLHWNHLDVIAGIPYITVQSLIENLDDDAPGRAAGAYGLARLREGDLRVEICGEDRARYQFHPVRSAASPAAPVPETP